MPKIEFVAMGYLFVVMLLKINDFMENAAVPTTIMKASILLYRLVTGTVSTEMQHHSYLLIPTPDVNGMHQ